MIEHLPGKLNWPVSEKLRTAALFSAALFSAALCIAALFRRSLKRTAVFFGLLFVASFSLSAFSAETVEPTDEERWQDIKVSMFGDAPIATDSNVIALEAPKRAHDAATVPITITALDSGRQLRKVHLIVDKNPAPIAGTFSFTEEAGAWQSMETRIRINEYTMVRAIGQLMDGSLHMATRFVKAAGGCSAPAMADMQTALERAGKMKLKLEELVPVDGLRNASAVIKISHPNNSGMQFDQISRNFIPAFFIHTIGVEMNGKPMLEVETNFSLSENPVIRLNFSPSAEHGELLVYSLDSKGNRSEQRTAFTGQAVTLQRETKTN